MKTAAGRRTDLATRPHDLHDTASADDPGVADPAGRLRPPELVLLHAQPGSPADWQQVTRRLPSVGPGYVNAWDKLLAAPGAGELCALATWQLTPWIARTRLAWLTWRHGRPPAPDEHVNCQVWAQASRDNGRLWRTFLAEQRAQL
jgi:hypothetical protein